jgi:glyoxylase-like metal-dependent hydrolase (beta-lactamase superfamily II)
MKRVVVLAGLIAAGALSLAIAAQQAPAAGGGRGQQAQGPRVVEVETLKENLFVLRGGGGNTAAFVTAKGVVVVDTKLPGWGQPILDKIKELTDQPVTTIINTHTHGDHVSGNVEFPATVDIVTHENTRSNMDRMASPPGMGPAQAPPQTIFQTNNGKGLPTRTFKDRMTLGSGPDRIELYYFGRGHTNGDAFVLFPALRTLHAGDMFPGKSVPIIDANNGGSGIDYPETLSKLHAGVNNVDAIITGHSTVMKWDDLREFAEFNRDFLNAVREGKKAGKSVDEIASGWSMPAKYTGYTAPQPNRLSANVRAVYEEIK